MAPRPGPRRQAAWRLALAALLLACGPLALVEAGQETVTGRLSVYWESEDRPLSAVVVQPRPGAVFRIINWLKLSEKGLPDGVRSGAQVAITGTRDTTSAGDHRVLFFATSITVVQDAPPSQLLASSGDGLSVQVVASAKLKTLIIRPRLPAKCNRLHRRQAFSGNKPEDWTASVRGASQLQQACTGGKLSYVDPVVTPYIEIPCTEMPADWGCADEVLWAWGRDAIAASKAKLGLDADNFDHIVIDLPLMDSCSWNGRGELSGREIYSHGILGHVNMAHEMGHNYGFSHSSVLALGPRQLPPVEPPDNPWDDTNLMGYSSGSSCFSFPHTSLVGLTKQSTLGPATLRPGVVKSVPLRPAWAPGTRQGVMLSTGKEGQRAWRIWASYMLTTSSPFPATIPSPVYNKAVVLHLSSTNWTIWKLPAVTRVKVLQSGDIFRWTLTGLVFKFAGVGANGKTATLDVCRETEEARCVMERSQRALGLPPQSQQVRLTMPNMEYWRTDDWCLRACTSAGCQLPKKTYTSRLKNVWFTSPCPKDASTAWYAVPHASGYAYWVNVATRRCLTLTRIKPYSYTSLPNNNEWYALKWRVVLAPCDSASPPEFRSNPQLWVPEPVPGREQPLVTLRSPLLYPNCPTCGVLHEPCVEACTDFDRNGTAALEPHCTALLPRARGAVRNTLAVAGKCWESNPQHVRPVPVQ